jgi:hypothetical protein
LSGVSYGSVSRLFPPRPEQEPAADQHRSTPSEEAKVPIDPLRSRHRLVDVVDPEQVVVDQTFHQVEIPKPISTLPARSLLDQRISVRRDVLRRTTVDSEP